ncbi:P-loop containing nucleoside triphosphate hydrolase protein [Ascodesmis nigricans]|uniref:P-loop containing nucleoside triphosphate hydrolase protein n=1 Tax=Ascodesmis nigricans TaxID=341454 RepID=A0A4S2MYE1_9PEZI|nr:P-loop containing nucleoside triphosphate hydrolase protein [Ascodesmis nigricans]
MPPRAVEIATTALELINAGDHDLQQTVLENLGNEEGLWWLRELLEKEYILECLFSDDNYRFGIRKTMQFDFHIHCIPVLRVLTDEDLMTSIALESTVGAIYKVVYGSSGARGIKFFAQLIRHLKDLYRREMEQPKETFEEPAYLVTIAFFHMVNLNQGAVEQTQLKYLVEQLTVIIREYRGHDRYYVRKATQHLEALSHRFNIRTAAIGHPKAPAPASQRFLTQLDPPGELSRLGPRHDNDSANIEDILVLPTNEEIASRRDPYIPYHITETHNHEGISTLLDTNFRLLREDTSGMIRDTLNHVIAQWFTIVVSDDNAARKRAIRGVDMAIVVYQNIRLERFIYDHNNLKFDISFDQPYPSITDMKPRDREAWWEEARILARGSLLALMQNKQTMFFSVADRIVVKEEKKNPDAPDHEPAKKKHESGIFDLATNPKRAMIRLELTEPSAPGIPSLLMELATSSIQESILVEFPRLLFASFDPVLKCLKEVHGKYSVPFSQWLAPSPGAELEHINGILAIPPPLYMTQHQDTTLDLQCVTSDGHRLTHSIESPVSIEALKKHTTLDNGQALSLKHAFQTGLALIQGPPGTGKSYVGVQLAKVLLANAKNLGLGPILCVTYTNHALDQFLEHLLDSGEKNIVRIGSRSKSERLQERMLSKLRFNHRQTRLEWRKMKEIEADMKMTGADLITCLERMRVAGSVDNIEKFLEVSYSDLADTLFDIASTDPKLDSDGFQQVQNKKYGKKDLYRLWTKNQPHPRRGRQVSVESNRPLEELSLIGDVWDTTPIERRTLLVHWETRIRKNLEDLFAQLLEEHTKWQTAFKRLRFETDRQCLSAARVIGVTSTSLASNAALLRSVQCKVLIIEEAGEVLEPHTIISLIPTIEHCILIGDHQQLRPQINTYDLSIESSQGKAHALDMSLFERLAVHGVSGYKVPIAQLDVQRRMHPWISDLIRHTLYPQLVDHSSTPCHPYVAGIRSRLFWLDHKYEEDGASQTGIQKDTSKCNEWEANMCVALVQHLSRQGVYKKDDIAVLTPYLGQLRKLRDKFRTICNISTIALDDRDVADLEEQDQKEGKEGETVENGPNLHVHNIISGLRLATVDNFQGEEAKVVIVSLVRSNHDRKVGFLRTSNRINVLLSRAQHGMYLIGNASTAEGIPMWNDIIRMLRMTARLGHYLELECPRHPNKTICVESPDDFNNFAPEGGCSAKCDRRLACGHACEVKCHSDYLHDSVRCLQNCLRSFPHCNHPCPKKCYEKCGNCRVPITSNITLPCGHIPKSVRCFETQELEKVRCYHSVTRVVEKCQHAAIVSCCTNMAFYRCQKLCKALLPCGHACQRKCGECHETDTVSHGPCKTPCGRLFTTCNHTCESPCHNGTPCGTCKKKCDIDCAHSKCSKDCGKPCVPCAEECTAGCVHQGKCRMPCAVPCDILPCDLRCQSVLECGHQCPSICGERCPDPVDGCPVCAASDVLDKLVDLITMQTLREVDVDEDPLIILPCKHVYTVSTLDGHMGMNQVYHVTSTGRVSSPKQFSKVPVKNCPECRYPLRTVHRYNRIVKAGLIDQATKRFMSHAALQFQEYLQKIKGWESAIEEIVEAFIARRRIIKSNDAGFFTRYIKETTAYLSELNRFHASLQTDEHPYGRMSALVQATRRKHGTPPMYQVDGSEIQHGFSLKTAALRLRLAWAVIHNHSKALEAIKLTNASKEVFKSQWEKVLHPQLRRYRSTATELASDATKRKFFYQELEGTIYAAMFTGLMYRYVPAYCELDEVEREKQLAYQSLEQCEARMTSATKSLVKDLVQAQLMLEDSTFHTEVSTEEKAEVYEAMAAGYQGTQNWYYCENKHPFTVGNCGMPVQVARCPECDARIGGREHELVAGVRPADDLRARFGRMAI